MISMIDVIRASAEKRAELAMEVLHAAQELYDEGMLTEKAFREVLELVEQGHACNAREQLETVVAQHLLENEDLLAIMSAAPSEPPLRAILGGKQYSSVHSCQPKEKHHATIR